MSRVFHDKFQMECTFLEDGITFCNSKRNVYFPYGSLDSLNMSFLGVMQAVSHALVCCFTADKKDKAEIKELLKQAKEKMKTAPREDAVLVDLEKIHVDQSLSPEEQLKQFKTHYIQGVISKDQYDLMKRILG